MPRRVLPLFLITILARTPYAAVGLLLIVRTKELAGSYAASGLVAGAASLALAASSPVVGRLVDRRGQTGVLRAAVAVNAAALAAFALMPRGVPPVALVACAVVAGASTPPIGACMRTLYPAILAGDDLHRAYAFESAALELTYIVGPMVMLTIAALAGTATALLAATATFAAGVLLFSATRASRGWKPVPHPTGSRSAALRSAGMQTIVIAIALAGATFGAVEVAVAAACSAAGVKGATGVLLAVWGAGSMLGGFAFARAGAPADAARWLALMLGALGIGDLALVPVSGPVALAAILLVAGAAVAPLLGTAYALLDRIAPAGGQTEAFAWVTTAISIGIAAGSATAGALVDVGGAGAGFATAAAAGLVACAVTFARAPSLRPVQASSERPVIAAG